MVESKLNHLLIRIESRGMTCWQTGMTMTMTHQYTSAGDTRGSVGLTPPVINISVYFIHPHKAQIHPCLLQAAVIHFTSEEDALMYTVNCNAIKNNSGYHSQGIFYLLLLLFILKYSGSSGFQEQSV